jgi:anti-sigma factor RsiW
MVDCRDFERLFAAYVDGEAPPADRAAIDAHVRTCSPCGDRLACEAEVRRALVSRREQLRASASEALRRRCADVGRPATGAAAGATMPRPGITLPRMWVPLSMAATILLAVAGVFFYGLRSGGEAFAAQLMTDHVKCFEVAPQPTVRKRSRASGCRGAAGR